jgi:hypothetical protein
MSIGVYRASGSTFFPQPHTGGHKERKTTKQDEVRRPVEIAATMEKSKTLRCFFPQLLG